MRKLPGQAPSATAIFFLLTLFSCHTKNQKAPDTETINAMNLKRGQAIACGPVDKQYGSVGLKISCTAVQKEFDLGIALLHSFEYSEAEKAFAKVIDAAPDCAMGYWGVAMSNYHPLWAPPDKDELEKGAKAIAIAQSIGASGKEGAYINATALFYKDHDVDDHRTRGKRFKTAMEDMYKEYPDDKEISTFYALALIATADPADKTFAQQKKAGDILNGLYPNQPNHPGVVHYIIHAYDYPELAQLGLSAARAYASVAPSSAHALHMPSHIFVRLGYWDEAISSNRASVASAQCYAESAGMKGHWDEELHGLDYLMYSYLQKGRNDSAKSTLDYLSSIKVIEPPNFKVAYAVAAIPCRYVVENKLWKEAAVLEAPVANFSWDKFYWEKALVHFTRALGAVHTGRPDSARAELKKLQMQYDALMNKKDEYKANLVQIQAKSAEAWILFKEGKNAEAVKLMTEAADIEDKTEKHPVTPGVVVPARELLGDMLLEMNKPAEALLAYESDLKRQPARFNGLYGAGLAAEKSNDLQKAGGYYKQLTDVAGLGTGRKELESAKIFLKANHSVAK